MKAPRFVRNMYCLWFFMVSLVSCSLFTPSVPSVVERMVQMAADQAMNEAGKALSDVPIEYEFEYDRLTKKMHMLCEADLR